MRRPKTTILVLLLSATLPALADPVIEWNALMLEAIRNESTPAPLAARNLAILHASMFDAVNSITRLFEPYFTYADAPAGASAEAAAASAGYNCLAYLYPSQAAVFNASLDAYLNNTGDTQSRSNGLYVGQQTALALLVARQSDGASTTATYIPSYNPGDWQRTPPFFRPPDLPQWPQVTPFAMTNGAQFRPQGPPALTSTQYAQDYNLTKDYGSLNSTNRTAEQTIIAQFWSDFNFTITPPGHWNLIAENVSTNLGCSLVQNSRLFALLNLALADAGIAAWDAKYTYNSWRPITAIWQGDLDGNPDTSNDTNWVSLLTTPPFPEYISGHSTFSGAASTILAAVLHSNDVPFSVGSDALPGTIRSYTNLALAAEEIGMSRIYAGIHFLSADLDGLATGRAVAGYVSRNFLAPLPVAAHFDSCIVSEGVVRLRLIGTAGQNYLLQSSTNLSTWNNLSASVAVDGVAEFVDSFGNLPTAAFYRVETVPIANAIR
jgi:membrane-associated phospholipid phosphatase